MPRFASLGSTADVVATSGLAATGCSRILIEASMTARNQHGERNQIPLHSPEALPKCDRVQRSGAISELPAAKDQRCALNTQIRYPDKFVLVRVLQVHRGGFAPAVGVAKNFKRQGSRGVRVPCRVYR